jgi:DNA gyrase/topoisomerase IV subunit B
MSKPPEVQVTPADAIALVRKRPGMYVGYVGAPPVAHFGEVLANAMDQALADRARTIEVILREDDSVEIRDDGPGAAREVFERALSGFHDTPTLDGHRPHVHLAGKGVGLLAISALSEWLEINTRQEGREHRLRTARGVFTLTETRPYAGPTGTSVSYRPDPTIFTRPTLDRVWLADHLTQLSDLCPGLALTVRDEGWKPARHREGLRSRVRGSHVIELEGEDADTTVRVVLSWRGPGFDDKPRVESFAGFEPSPLGGTHVKGLLAALGEVGAERAVALEVGLDACLVVVTPDIVWGGPTRERVAMPELARVVKGIVKKQLVAYFDTHPETLEKLAQR